MKNSNFLVWLQLILSLGAYTLFIQMFGWGIVLPLSLFHFALNLQLPIRESRTQETINKLLKDRHFEPSITECDCEGCEKFRQQLNKDSQDGEA